MFVVGAVKLPANEAVAGGERELPYVFIADEAFPLKEHLMRPFPGAQLVTENKKIYNYRLSRARRVVENAFGECIYIFTMT